MNYFYQPTNAPSLATIAQVTSAQSSYFSSLGTTQQQGGAMFGPSGVYYRPKEKDRVLLLLADGTQVCVGVLAPPKEMEGGELLLQSDGGATIHLRNNGEIVLNGLRITKEGQIVAPKGGTP